jgi:Chaperone of endosialidase
MKTKNMTTSHLKNSIGRSPLRIGLPRVQRIWIIRGFLLIALAVASLALSPMARAVGPPVPDGGYPGENTAEGQDALFFLTQGIANTAIGFEALFHNTTGSENTATGHLALLNNTGNDNTANGTAALQFNTTGIGNTASGAGAMQINDTGDKNTANGVNALQFNTSGSFNTANGAGALLGNDTGDKNTADGANALQNNTTGNSNTANGFGALYSNTSGSGNIALGLGAGLHLTTGDNNIDIGNQGFPGEGNTIRVGTVGTHKATFIAGIIGAPVAGPTVHVNGSGQLGIGPPSSKRFKDTIKPMGEASEAILRLKPVTFRYKKELDPDGVPQFGLVAEEVEKVNPDLVTRDDQGKVYTVRYEAVNAMLLNEFLKQHRKVEKQEATITQLKSSAAKQEAIAAQQQEEIKALTASLKEQDSKIEKVSAQVEVDKAAPQTVLNNQ